MPNTERDEQMTQEPAPGLPDGAGVSSSTSTSSSAPAVSGTPTHARAKRGFAAMDETTQRTIASKGGQSQGKENNPGNFANNRERAREAGRKGGEAHGHRAQAAHASTHHP